MLVAVSFDWAQSDLCSRHAYVVEQVGTVPRGDEAGPLPLTAVPPGRAGVGAGGYRCWVVTEQVHWLRQQFLHAELGTD